MKRLFKQEDGSITLEAAIFMPFFILFLVFLIYMVKFSLIDIAVNRATSETAKQIATQIYPAKVLVDEVHTLAKSNEKYSELEAGVAENIDLIETSVTETLGEDTYNDIKAKVGQPLDEAGAAALTTVVRNYLQLEDQRNIVESENVKVTEAKLPNVFTSGGSEYVELTTQYELDLPIPFIKETFIIEKRAKERAWVGS
ncbi:TadE/TadG family type IV pilus assembly protein [Gracilibacillus massiliensis]|uniref:TadE/TadG family type IV pilus assembly protein n=1 Tax=Gracilibacillus massiliensis TaxID=1564956 RepID=UPI00071D7842|nr:pilus assembly protein [Gracilibacillus massiliensis]